MRTAAAILFVICAVTALRVAATHDEFSPTWDEPVHVAAGFEYLTTDRYTKDLQHPPLSRALMAWPLRHARPASDDVWNYAAEVYDSAGGYMRGVALARRGNLLFLVAAIVGVFCWCVQLARPATALLAAALFALLPPILAHGGLATTDIAGTAAFAWAMAAMHFWLSSPTWRRTLLLALAIGIGLVSKFSFPLFFAIGAIVMMVARRRFPLLKGAVAHLLAFIIVWGVYGWEHSRLARSAPEWKELAVELHGTSFLVERRLPASRWFAGMMLVQKHNREGHGAYLLGELRDTGWWYYFPVAVGVKTPLPFLALAAAGVVLASRRRRRSDAAQDERVLHVAVIALLILASTMTSRINIGLRHVLPIYVPLAIVAACGAATLLESRRGRLAAVALIAWLFAGSVAAHPDYLPWMNAIAGQHPEKILLDSNLDWGQDVYRLAKETRGRGIAKLHVNLFGNTDHRRIGLSPTEPIDPHRGAPGWYAISETQLVAAQVSDPTAFRWLTDGHTYLRVGKTIRLYHVE